LQQKEIIEEIMKKYEIRTLLGSVSQDLLNLMKKCDHKIWCLRKRNVGKPEKDKFVHQVVNKCPTIWFLRVNEG